MEVVNSTFVTINGTAFVPWSAQEGNGTAPSADNGLLAGLAALTIVLMSFFYYPMVFLFGFVFNIRGSRRNGILHSDAFLHNPAVMKAFDEAPTPATPPTPEVKEDTAPAIPVPPGFNPENVVLTANLGPTAVTTGQPQNAPLSPGNSPLPAPLPQHEERGQRRVSLSSVEVLSPKREEESAYPEAVILAIKQARSLRINRVVKGSATVAAVFLGLLFPSVIWLLSQTQLVAHERWQGVGVLASAAVTAEVTGFFKQQIKK